MLSNSRFLSPRLYTTSISRGRAIVASSGLLAGFSNRIEVPQAKPEINVFNCWSPLRKFLTMHIMAVNIVPNMLKNNADQSVSFPLDIAQCLNTGQLSNFFLLKIIPGIKWIGI